MFLAFLYLTSSSLALAQDPVQVDPKHYKVEVDNEHVRVLRFHIGPNERTPMHEHPLGVVIELTAGHLRFTMPDGKIEEHTVAAGSVRYRPAVKQHAVENRTGADVEAIEVEVKPNH